jgi:hypothetical protein
VWRSLSLLSALSSQRIGSIPWRLSMQDLMDDRLPDVEGGLLEVEDDNEGSEGEGLGGVHR